MSRFKTTADYRIFLDLLVKARTERGVSQEELAQKLDLAPDQVAAFEKGQRQLDFVQTRQWCIALGASFLDFMVQLDEAIPAPLQSDADAPVTEQTEGGPR